MSLSTECAAAFLSLRYPSFMSNIIREIFVEDHVQQVSTETLRDLNLLHSARDFKFCMSQAQKACENIRVF